MSTVLLANVLIAAEWEVELHKVMFPGEGEKPDHEWIPIVAGRGMAIITSDKKMAGWRADGGRARRAIEQSHAKVFFVRSAGLSPEDQAHAIGLAKRHLCRCVKKHAGTYMMARIHTKGNRIGEVLVLNSGGDTKTQKRYGSDVA